MKEPCVSSLLDIKVSCAVHYLPIKLVEVSTFSALIFLFIEKHELFECTSEIQLRRCMTLDNANNVADRLRKMSIRFSVVIHTYNVLSHSWDYISGGTRGPVTLVSLHLVILKGIISIKTYSPMHKKIVNTCSHSNITV